MNKFDEYFDIKLKNDIKRYYYGENEASLLSIMRFFTDKNVPDLEKKSVTEDVDLLYLLLGWEEASFDVIYSFWGMFSFGLHYVFPDEYKKAEAGNIQAYKERNKKCPWLPSFPENFFSGEKGAFFCACETFKIYTSLAKYAGITHSVSNFVPIPDAKFNYAKGTSEAKDFLPLFVDLIEESITKENTLKYYENDKTAEISIEMLIEWKNALVSNRDDWALQNEYKVDENTGKLIGCKLFDSQSLQQPFPPKEEYEQCLDEIIQRNENRREILLQRIKKLNFPELLLEKFSQ